MIFTALTPDFFMLRSRSVSNGIATSTVGIPYSMFISSIEGFAMYILTTLPLSADSGLLTVKHVQKHDHTQACKQMNERHQNSVRSNRTRRKRRDVTDEAQRQNHGQQYHADQGEQRRTLEAHGRDYTPTSQVLFIPCPLTGMQPSTPPSPGSPSRIEAVADPLPIPKPTAVSQRSQGSSGVRKASHTVPVSPCHPPEYTT